MKTLAALGISICLCTTSLLCTAIAQQSDSAPAATAPDTRQAAPNTPPRDHEWLKGLVGEWTTTWKMYMGPDQPPIEAAGTDSVRAVGDYWVVAEAKSEMLGAPYNGIMSLGYDAERKQFHGTWIDSFCGRLWVYKGTLNDAGDTLTLETEGPSPQDPSKIVKYKETMRVNGPDSRAFTSTYQAEDGKWVRLVAVEFQRKRPS